MPAARAVALGRPISGQLRQFTLLAAKGGFTSPQQQTDQKNRNYYPELFPHPFENLFQGSDEKRGARHHGNIQLQRY
jgi:hypothetical protein